MLYTFLLFQLLQILLLKHPIKIFRIRIYSVVVWLKVYVQFVFGRCYFMGLTRLLSYLHLTTTNSFFVIAYIFIYLISPLISQLHIKFFFLNLLVYYLLIGLQNLLLSVFWCWFLFKIQLLVLQNDLISIILFFLDEILLFFHTNLSLSSHFT